MTPMAATTARKPQGTVAFVSPVVNSAANVCSMMPMGARSNSVEPNFGGAVPPPPPPDPLIMRQKTKLFVGNLPSDISQEAIHLVFSYYGTVTNIHIMAGKAKSGQSCAFVEYSAPIEAETAVLTLHEKYEICPGDGCIMVKYANSTPRTGPY